MAKAWSASKPVLAPGGFYNYNSFCHLKTPVGHDARRIHDGDAVGETFEARIAPFTLAVPNALN